MEVMQLFAYFPLGSDGIRHLLSQGGAVAGTQAMDLGSQSVDRQLELRREIFLVRGWRRGSAQERTQRGKNRLSPLGCIRLFHNRQRLVDQRGSPPFFEKLVLGARRERTGGRLRRNERGRFHGKEFLAQGQELAAAPAFESLRVRAGIGQEVLERCQQESAESAPVRIGPGIQAILQHVSEERLGKILGIAGRVATTPHERVNRRPVAAAEVGQRAFGDLTAGIAGFHHQTPVGGNELRAPHLQRPWRELHRMDRNSATRAGSTFATQLAGSGQKSRARDRNVCIPLSRFVSTSVCIAPCGHASRRKTASPLLGSLSPLHGRGHRFQPCIAHVTNASNYAVSFALRSDVKNIQHDGKPLSFMRSSMEPVDHLGRLSPVLAAARARSVVVIEDMDRNGVGFDLSQIQPGSGNVSGMARYPQAFADFGPEGWRAEREQLKVLLTPGPIRFHASQVSV